MDTANACGNRLFKVTVPQTIEMFAVFNHPKKCFLYSSDFRRKTGIFCAAVVNERASWPFKNRTAVNLLKSQVLIQRKVIGRKRV